MKTSLKPDHLKFRGSAVEDANKGRLGVVGPPRMGQPVDVIHGILCLALYGDNLVFLDMPGVLSVHCDGSIITNHLHVQAVRSNIGEFDVKGR